VTVFTAPLPHSKNTPQLPCSRTR